MRPVGHGDQGISRCRVVGEPTAAQGNVGGHPLRDTALDRRPPGRGVEIAEPGLDAVRSFASVVRDLRPDQGMMLTTVGYTEDARTFAEDEGIALGILRDFRAAELKFENLAVLTPAECLRTTWQP